MGEGRCVHRWKKTAAIAKIKKEVRQFLGLTGYYHWFVPGFADLTFPLIELTRMGASDLVQWTESWQVEFVQVKMAMWGAAAHSPDSPPLYPPD